MQAGNGIWWVLLPISTDMQTSNYSAAFPSFLPVTARYLLTGEHSGVEEVLVFCIEVVTLLG
ncbi:MAG: hypothetical protein QG646_3380 [Euryarchaeota archaeon]|nr:hypothetical protein [Euryarchaeota archaeon]